MKEKSHVSRRLYHYVYCCVEDTCRTIVDQPLRNRGFMPKLSDAEVITMEIVGEFMGKDQDKDQDKDKGI